MALERRLIARSSDLAEGGAGLRFTGGGTGTAFAVRFGGVVRAFANRCPHRGVELDWEPGAFFDETGLYLVCSTHGAVFDPSSGLCIAGPCKGARLETVAVVEQDGEIRFPEADAARAAHPEP